MPLYYLARMTTATTGTGTITLGTNVASYLSFDDAGIPNAAAVRYGIVDGNNREVTDGVYTASGTTLTRGAVVESTNGGSAISLSGSAEVFVIAGPNDYGSAFEGFRVQMAASQSGLSDSAETQVAFGTEIFDVGSKFATNAWTPSAGKVFMHASIYMTEGSGKIQEVSLAIRENGTDDVVAKFFKATSATLDDIVLDVSVLLDTDGSTPYTVWCLVNTPGGTWEIIDAPERSFFTGWRVG